MTYPKYYKSAAFQIKVISNTMTLWVGDMNLQVMGNMDDFIAERKYQESTEQEFNKSFNKTSKYLKSLI